MLDRHAHAARVVFEIGVQFTACCQLTLSLTRFCVLFVRCGAVEFSRYQAGPACNFLFTLGLLGPSAKRFASGARTPGDFDETCG